MTGTVTNMQLDLTTKGWELAQFKSEVQDMITEETLILFLDVGTPGLKYSNP